jgi:hypothetical protein
MLKHVFLNESKSAFCRPRVPNWGLDRSVAGIVTADLIVGSDGKVQPIKSVPQYPLLRESVESALKQWTFQPLSRTQKVRVTTEFRLDTDCPQTGSSQPDTNHYVYTRGVADLPLRLEMRSCLPIVVINSSSHL